LIEFAYVSIGCVLGNGLTLALGGKASVTAVLTAQLDNLDQAAKSADTLVKVD